MLKTDYSAHERVYANDPTASGWNSREVDEEILSYLQELLTVVGMSPPATILELGCGMGNLAIPLAAWGFQVTGIDISPTAVAVAGRRASSAKVDAAFRSGDLTDPDTYCDLPKFDSVVDGLCLHCIIGGHRDRFIRSIRSVLKPGGCFLVMTMCGDPRAVELQNRFNPATRYVTSGGVARRYLGQTETLIAELLQYRFEIAYQRVATGPREQDQDMLLAAARTSGE